MKPDSGLFSKDQTLAALWHARNRQYLCVYSCYGQLDPSACTEKVINLMKRALMPDRLHQAWTSSSLPVCWCWHPCNKQQTSHPKSHDMILSFFFFFFCIFSHFFKGAVGNHVFSCIISLLPKCLCRGSAGRTPPVLHIYGIVFPSEAIRIV